MTMKALHYYRGTQQLTTHNGVTFEMRLLLLLVVVVVTSQNAWFILSDDMNEVTIREDDNTSNEVNYVFDAPALSSTTHLFANQQIVATVLCCIECQNNDDDTIAVYLNFVIKTLDWTDVETILFDETCIAVLKEMDTNQTYLHGPSLINVGYRQNQLVVSLSVSVDRTHAEPLRELCTDQCSQCPTVVALNLARLQRYYYNL